MPAGITVYNDSGTIQIDENYQNLFVVASGTGGTIPAASNYTSAAMVAVAYTSAARYTFGSSVAAGVKWWVFDTLPVTAANPGYGLQVWTADGKLAFDTAWKPMRFVAAVGPVSGTPTFNYPSGREYAVILGRYEILVHEETSKGGGSSWDHVYDEKHSGAVVSGNQVTVAHWTKTHNEWNDEFEDPPQGEYDNTYGQTTFYVVDVTHY